MPPPTIATQKDKFKSSAKLNFCAPLRSCVRNKINFYFKLYFVFSLLYFKFKTSKKICEKILYSVGYTKPVFNFYA